MSLRASRRSCGPCASAWPGRSWRSSARQPPISRKRWVIDLRLPMYLRTPRTFGVARLCRVLVVRRRGFGVARRCVRRAPRCLRRLACHRHASRCGRRVSHKRVERVGVCDLEAATDRFRRERGLGTVLGGSPAQRVEPPAYLELVTAAWAHVRLRRVGLASMQRRTVCSRWLRVDPYWAFRSSMRLPFMRMATCPSALGAHG